MIDRNATQAAARAGFAQPHVQGPRLLANVEVQQALATKLVAQEVRIQRSADDIARKRWAIIEDPKSATGDVLTALRDEAKRYAEYKDAGTSIDARSVNVTQLTDEQLARLSGGR